VETTELLRRAVEVFDRLGIRYFVTGSVAAIFYGGLRLTNDVDIVLDLPLGHIRDLSIGSTSTIGSPVWVSRRNGGPWKRAWARPSGHHEDLEH
jgi:hypothetical protein